MDRNDDSSSHDDAVRSFNIFSDETIDQANKIMDYFPTGIISNSRSEMDCKRINVTPAPKKRMFDHDDYTQMMNDGLFLDSDDVNNPEDEVMRADAFCVDDGYEEDVIEISRSFAMNYWHSTENSKEQEGRDVSQQLEEQTSCEEDAVNECI